MSRTDKDTPWWTRATEWEPLHRVSCRFGNRVCDLPLDPVREPVVASRRRSGCFWWPVTGQRPFAAPPKWYVDHRYHNVQRVEVRDGCRRMLAEYRGGGEVEHEVLPRQGRHSAWWSWS